MGLPGIFVIVCIDVDFKAGWNLPQNQCMPGPKNSPYALYFSHLLSLCVGLYKGKLLLHRLLAAFLFEEIQRKYMICGFTWPHQRSGAYWHLVGRFSSFLSHKICGCRHMQQAYMGSPQTLTMPIQLFQAEAGWGLDHLSPVHSAFV